MKRRSYVGYLGIGILIGAALASLAIVVLMLGDESCNILPLAPLFPGIVGFVVLMYGLSLNRPGH